MSLVLENASLFLGRELTYVENGFIEIGHEGKIIRAQAGRFDKKNTTAAEDRNNEILNSTHYGRSKKKQTRDNDNDVQRFSFLQDKGSLKIFDASGLLIMPGFINAHTHIADSIGKDIAVDDDDGGLEKRVHPVFGIKKKILQKSTPDHLKAFIRNSAISMLKKGTVAFADFREGGAPGIELIKEATADLPIKKIILGRVEHYYSDPSEKNQKTNTFASTEFSTAQHILNIGDGFGISGANENTDAAMEWYHNLITNQKSKKFCAIHAAESRETVEFSISKTGKTEIDRALEFLDPDILVHLTHASSNDIQMIAARKKGIVICPRSNGILGVGIPKVIMMQEYGCTVGIGTDNVMLNSPDMFRELDYIWKASRAMEQKYITARDLLKMATVNGADILGLDSGCIEPGRSADLILFDKNHLDLFPIHNPHAAIINRASEGSIKDLMIDGRFINLSSLGI